MSLRVMEDSATLVARITFLSLGATSWKASLRLGHYLSSAANVGPTLLVDIEENNLEKA